MFLFRFYMNRRYGEKKKLQKNIAHNRIQYLFSHAEKSALQGKFILSDRYVTLARKISMKYLVPIPAEYKRRYCKHCYCYILPPVTCRIRIHHAMIITYCRNCKKYSRIPLYDRPSTCPKPSIHKQEFFKR
jgi:ribonuclease P protein subunit RPR2